MYHQHHECIPDLLSACEKAWNAGRRNSSITSDHWSFIGRTFDGFPSLLKAYYAPWQQGLDEVQGMIYQIEREGHSLPVPKLLRRKPVFHPDDGDEIDNDRLRCGQDYWRKCVRQNLQGPQFITLFTNIASSGSRRSSDVLWRGAVAIVLCDLLEKAGYRVGVNLCHYSRGVYCKFRGSDYEQSLMTVNVKREEDTVDIPSLVNVVSGWFYRGIAFQARHIRQEEVSYGYGNPQTITEDLDFIQELTGNNAAPIVIDNIWSREVAIQKIKHVINKLNGVEDE